MKKFDLIVCGAGMAGFAAAIGAARAGSKVLLLDKMPSVGYNDGSDYTLHLEIFEYYTVDDRILTSTASSLDS